MTNVPQNPNQKMQDDRYSNDSGQAKQNEQGQNQGNARPGQIKNDEADASRKGGMQNDPNIGSGSGKDQNPRREQELSRSNPNKK